MNRIVIDPVTRIEGHLRIEASIENGVVTDAWASGGMFRGIELIVKGRDPRDAWIFVQRICGVCTTVHAIASVRAVEMAIGARVPPNARLIRNIIQAVQNIHDHVVHFYHLHALDWVDIVSALSADTQKTSDLAQSISPWPLSSKAYFDSVAKRLKDFVDRGQLGPFANAYWGHPAYVLPPEVNLLGVAHYLEALEWQRQIVKIHSMLSGKNPHIQGLLVGGVSMPVDANSQAAINAHTIKNMKSLIKQAKDFISQVYLPDVVAIAPFYKDWAAIGPGHKNYLVFGDFPESDDPKNPANFFPGGVIYNGDIANVQEFDPKLISEFVTRSYYSYAAGDDKGLHPYDGETSPKYTGPKPPFEYLDVENKYSWLKSPRYDGKVMEVGPLSRMLVAYAKGMPRAKELVDGLLGKLGVGPEALFSTLGRIAARALESQIMVERIDGWIDELAGNMQKGDFRIADNTKWDPSTWPADCQGVGFHEAPRGTLSHWVHIKDGKIFNYQAVVPSTWNAGPRDAQDQRGVYEACLVGTPVANPEQPLELLRTIHSFDPCLGCAVHVVDATTGKEIANVRVR